MKILAIESSCDETSVSIVEGEGSNVSVLSCETATSLNLHKETGGIIPERAARKQIEFMLPTLNEALKKAFPSLSPNPEEYMQQIDAIAVTVGPGLIGSLLVGVETARTLAMTFDKPIIPVNHVKAHIYASFINHTPNFPLLAAVVSGGHTDFVLMSDHNKYERVGGTRDDAAGECFDKCARIIGLQYPGGPSIAKEADSFREDNPDIKLNLLPRPLANENTFDVSFSGLKTAVLRLKESDEGKKISLQRFAAEIEEAITDTLINKVTKIVESKDIKNVVFCGGVSANKHMREVFEGRLEAVDATLIVPELEFSTDNAAMIGSFALFNKEFKDWEDVSPDPELHF